MLVWARVKNVTDMHARAAISVPPGGKRKKGRPGTDWTHTMKQDDRRVGFSWSDLSPLTADRGVMTVSDVEKI